MLRLFDTASSVANGENASWDLWVAALGAASDLLLFFACFTAAAVFLILRKGADPRLAAFAVPFAVLLALVGLAHLIALATVWQPVHGLRSFVEVVMVAVALAAAFLVLRLAPALAMRPDPAEPAEPAETIEDFRREMKAHRAALGELGVAHHEVEACVAERTAELQTANRRLEIVTREIMHRSKNLMTIVLGLAAQTAQGTDDKEEFLEKLSGRLASLGAALDVVVRSDGHGVDIAQLICSQVDHYSSAFTDRIQIKGPVLNILPDAAQQIALATHELATNALKHGALSTKSGTVSIAWRVDRPEHGEALVILEWREHSWLGKNPSAAREHGARMDGARINGEARADRESRRGVGSELLDETVPRTLRGTADRRILPTGLSYTLIVPLKEMAASEHAETTGLAAERMPMAAAG